MVPERPDGVGQGDAAHTGFIERLVAHGSDRTSFDFGGDIDIRTFSKVGENTDFTICHAVGKVFFRGCTDAFREMGSERINDAADNLSVFRVFRVGWIHEEPACSEALTEHRGIRILNPDHFKPLSDHFDPDSRKTVEIELLQNAAEGGALPAKDRLSFHQEAIERVILVLLNGVLYFTVELRNQHSMFHVFKTWRCHDRREPIDLAEVFPVPFHGAVCAEVAGKKTGFGGHRIARVSRHLAEVRERGLFSR